jgi:dephospho-CoA kinase
VGNPKKKPIIGILGGICSGKSAVASELGKLGCEIIDADKIAHELLDEPAIKRKMVSSFGQDILDSAGKIDRSKLADIVFADARKLSSINRIVHPPVLARIERLIEQYNGEPAVRAIVLDMPLLVEVSWAKRCDRLVFVDCKWQIRAERAKKVGLFDENQLKIRENLQISLDKKVDIADNIIDNNSGFQALARQVADIFSNIMDNG